MMNEVNLRFGWKVFQDVHDNGENLKIWEAGFRHNRCDHLLSGWEDIPRLAALQVLFSDTPYFGRELRYFNQAPWWYKNTFSWTKKDDENVILSLSGVDYYSKVWLNGECLGEHEGYFDTFSFDVTSFIKEGENNLYIKVWAPWDKDVLKNGETMRCFSIKREMVKGTYEHADGFIQRDVNPVGIMGEVKVSSKGRSFFSAGPSLRNTLNDDYSKGIVEVKGTIDGAHDECFVTLRVADEYGVVVSEKKEKATSDYNMRVEVGSPMMWNVWERGEQALYTVSLFITDKKDEILDKWNTRIGFRDIALVRTKDKTEFYLNGKRIFLRGTSYFADIYMSEMTRERYLRDLRMIIECGFNAVRVHVHVENKAFYDYCDELGLLVIQDSDFNWDHPTTKEWMVRSKNVFSSMVRTLKSHPSIICWIALNEPDVWKIFTKGLLESTEEDQIMLSTLCSYLLNVLKTEDPDRPYIKASREENDIESGDSHTYTGSLAVGTNYTDIDGTFEKLNSEFGMDIPSSIPSLMKEKRIGRRMEPIFDRIDDLQFYQYKLIKYYIEHYRNQKYSPCSGFFQFMFIDLCPQSFYGVVDFYGIPKFGINAIYESCKPISVFAVKNGKGFVIKIANDTLKEYKGTVAYSVIKDGISILNGTYPANVGEDTLAEVGNIEFTIEGDYDLLLSFRDESGKEVSNNKYLKAFNELPHIEGHSVELDNELGMRLFRKDYQ